MQLYQSHKQVHAEPMTLGAYNDYRGWTIPEDEESETPGYLVVYNRDTENHYESWLSALIFDDRYTPITDSVGFARLFHSEKFGQILISLTSDPETGDPTLEVTIERPYMGLLIPSDDFTDQEEVFGVLATVTQETAIRVAESVRNIPYDLEDLEDNDE